MTKKTNLDVVTEIVKEEMAKGPIDRQMKNVILHRIKEQLSVSPNNCSVYMAKAIKRVQSETLVVAAEDATQASV